MNDRVDILQCGNIKIRKEFYIIDIPSLSFQDLHDFTLKCEEQLLIKNPYEFIYPDGVRNNDDDENSWCKNIPKIKQMNENLLVNLRHNANLYAIFTRDSKDDIWQVVYVGERKSEGMRDRITQHLINKNIGTGSKLDKVKEVVRSGGFIGVSFLKVQPESIRLYVEEHIINNNKDTLTWNKHGKR